MAHAPSRPPAGSSFLPPLIDLAYLGAAAAASPWLAYKFVSDARYRTGLRERLGFHAARPPARPALWVHGVSVGEIVAGVPLVEAFRTRHPDWDIILSTVTVTGQAVAQRRFAGVRVVYFPLDLGGAVRRTLRRLAPSVIVTLELELWPNFFLAAERMGVPLLILNGRVTPRSVRRYRWVRLLVRRILSRAAAVCTQSPVHAERYLSLGAPPDRVQVTGNMKFDGAPVPAEDPYADAFIRVLGIRAGDAVLVGGSTHGPEEESLLRAYGRLRARAPGLRLVLVPRHPERADAVHKTVVSLGHVCYKSSVLAAAPGVPGDLARAVLVVDSVGELRKIYGVATLAFLGGSLVPHGGQNMLEAAALGCPVIFGPHVENFREIAEALLSGGAATQVPDEEALVAAAADLLDSPGRLREMGAAGRRVVDTGRGATERNLRILESALSNVRSLTRSQN